MNASLGQLMGGSVAFPFKQIVPYFRYTATFYKTTVFRKVKVDTPPLPV